MPDGCCGGSAESAAGHGPREFPGVLDLLILGVGDLLDKVDDGSPKLCVWDLHEGFGEVEPVGRGEVVCYILRIGSVSRCTTLSVFR